MGRTIEATGKSIDEAIFNGLKELEISIDEVEIDILQNESKGLLGIGARQAKVRLIEREPEEIIIPQYLNQSTGYDRPERRDRRDRFDRRPPRADRPDRPAADRPAFEHAERPEHAAYDRPERRDRYDRRERTDRRGGRSEEPHVRREPPEKYTLEAASGNPAAEFLSGLLAQMGIEGKVLACTEEDGIRLYVDSESTGMLIGRRGDTLDAIQYLVSLAANRDRKEKGYTRVTIDAEGYREKREETLTRLARKIASQVKATGRPRALEPMNPYERRILHATLQSNPDVTTRSEGEEPNRHVVVLMREKDGE